MKTFLFLGAVLTFSSISGMANAICDGITIHLSPAIIAKECNIIGVSVTYKIVSDPYVKENVPLPSNVPIYTNRQNQTSVVGKICFNDLLKVLPRQNKTAHAAVNLFFHKKYSCPGISGNGYMFLSLRREKIALGPAYRQEGDGFYEVDGGGTEHTGYHYMLTISTLY